MNLKKVLKFSGCFILVIGFLVIYKLLLKMRDSNLNENLLNFTFLFSLLTMFISSIYSYNNSCKMKVYLSFGKTRKEYLKSYIKTIIVISFILIVLNLSDIVCNYIIFGKDESYLFNSLYKMIFIFTSIVFSSLSSFIIGMYNKKIYFIIPIICLLIGYVVLYYLNINIIYIGICLVNIICSLVCILVIKKRIYEVNMG